MDDGINKPFSSHSSIVLDRIVISYCVNDAHIKELNGTVSKSTLTLTMGFQASVCSAVCMPGTQGYL